MCLLLSVILWCDVQAALYMGAFEQFLDPPLYVCRTL